MQKVEDIESNSEDIVNQSKLKIVNQQQVNKAKQSGNDAYISENKRRGDSIKIVGKRGGLGK